MMSASTSIRFRSRRGSPVCSSLTVIGWCRAVTVPSAAVSDATVAPRVADGRDVVADVDAGGVGTHDRQPGGVLQLEDRDVLGGVVAEHLGVVRRPGSRHGHLDVGGALDDVVVGDHEPVAADHDAGARGLARAEADLARDRHQAGRLLGRRLGGVERGGGRVRRDVAVARVRRPAAVDEDGGAGGGSDRGDGERQGQRGGSDGGGGTTEAA